MKYLTEQDRIYVKKMLHDAVICFDLHEDFEAYNFVMLAMDKMKE